MDVHLNFDSVVCVVEKIFRESSKTDGLCGEKKSWDGGSSNRW